MGDESATLIVDLTSHTLDTMGDFWDALSEPLALPAWFGRNMDALWDTIETGGISARVDELEHLEIRASADEPLFVRPDDKTRALLRLFRESTRARLCLIGPDQA